MAWMALVIALVFAATGGFLYYTRKSLPAMIKKAISDYLAQQDEEIKSIVADEDEELVYTPPARVTNRYNR